LGGLKAVFSPAQRVAARTASNAKGLGGGRDVAAGAGAGQQPLITQALGPVRLSRVPAPADLVDEPPAHGIAGVRRFHQLDQGGAAGEERRASVEVRRGPAAERVASDFAPTRPRMVRAPSPGEDDGRGSEGSFRAA
jgi:hypothetical protein